jgi:hypothetical protein
VSQRRDHLLAHGFDPASQRPRAALRKSLLIIPEIRQNVLEDVVAWARATQRSIKQASLKKAPARVWRIRSPRRPSARDVLQMNRTVQAAGLPPMVAMVVGQYPRYGGPGHRIARIAEEALSKAGAIVIQTDDYYRRYHGQAMNVSRWEGHPNEVANYIWARMIMSELQVRRDLRAFQR